MKRRLLYLLMLIMVFTLSPAAFANHCERCTYVEQKCVLWFSGGFEYCDDFSQEGCVVAFPCGPHASPVTPLATEFTVAAVERLDEPQTAAPETLVASAATPPAPAIR